MFMRTKDKRKCILNVIIHIRIPGQRLAGRNRNVAKARQMAIEKRSKTLLVEYSERDKQNSFKDNRFGETDASLSIEEKMLRRFQEQVLFYYFLIIIMYRGKNNLKNKCII